MSETDGDPHRAWEELAAGHVLGALEAEEEELFGRHLTVCPRCTKLVMAYRGMLAGLDDTAGSSDGQAPSLTATKSVRWPGARPRWLTTAVAAVVCTLLGVGIGVAVAGSVPPPKASPPVVSTAVVSCLAVGPGCPRVTMTGPDGGTQAVALVLGNDVWIVTDGLARTSASQRYMLWQLPSSGSPILLATFDVNDVRGSTIHAGQLRRDLTATEGFLISAEPRAAPAPHGPTHPVATGVLVANG